MWIFNSLLNYSAGLFDKITLFIHYNLQAAITLRLTAF